MIDSMRLLLWDIDNRTYSYYIEVSTDQTTWHQVVDKRNEMCKSWQYISFPKRPVVFIRIVGTYNTANEVFHCVHFECPAQVPSKVLSKVLSKSPLPVNPDQENGTNQRTNNPQPSNNPLPSNLSPELVAIVQDKSDD